ncbi:MAG TPA: MOFRL family protein, partial [Pirellulales bacterium]
FLSAAGADIGELNTVRKQLSRIKGGGLARACRAGQLLALVISDVLGDPLDLIASGPTMEDRSTPQKALAILQKFGATVSDVPQAVLDALSRQAAKRPAATQNLVLNSCRVQNIIIGNNATAVDAAGMEAERLGYLHAMTCAAKPEGAVEQIGRHLADMALHMQATQGPNCLISGGEGTVKLVPAAQRGVGGRNQQTVLSAMLRLMETEPQGLADAEFVILSGGTDGEDGPTDAAGAIIDREVMAAAQRLKLDAAAVLARNDAYNFFEPMGALVKTGATGTNVCDLRVVLVGRK